MPSHTYDMTTDKSPEVVFDALADLGSAAEWMPMIKSVEKVAGPDQLAVGTRYLVSSSQDMLDYEAVEVERPSLVVWKVTNPKVNATDRWEFSPTADGGTAVAYTTDMEMQGLLGKISSPVSSLMLKGMDGSMEKAMAKRVEEKS